MKLKQFSYTINGEKKYFDAIEQLHISKNRDQSLGIKIDEHSIKTEQLDIKVSKIKHSYEARFEDDFDYLESKWIKKKENNMNIELVINTDDEQINYMVTEFIMDYLEKNSGDVKLETCPELTTVCDNDYPKGYIRIDYYGLDFTHGETAQQKKEINNIVKDLKKILKG